MYEKVKLSKRQIKEDKFTTFILSSKQQVQDNWQFLAIGLVIVILLVVAVAYYFENKTAAVNESALDYAKAVGEYRSDNKLVASNMFQQIVTDNKDDQITEKSLFMLGKINFDMRNYTEAVRYWEEYISKYKTNKLNISSAYAGIGASYENQGQYTQGAENFLKAAEIDSDGPLIGDFYTGAMRNYLLAGDKVKAKEQLDIIKEKFDESDLYIRAARYYGEKLQAIK